MFVVFILALCITDIFAGKCTLHFEKNSPGIFWRNLGTNHVLLDVVNYQVEWDDRSNVTGFCSGGFRLPNAYKTQRIGNGGSFSCLGTDPVVYWQPLDEPFGDQILIAPYDLSCPRPTQYYEASIPMCNDYGLAYGFFVESIPLVVAGSCYNLKSMQTRFLHYVAGPQNAIVEYHVALNSVNLTTDARRVTMDCINIKDEKNILAQAVEDALPKYKDALHFELDDLISFRRSQTVTGAYFDDLNCVNMIPWWTSLKHGNWKTVEEIVNDLARYRTYDIYTGTSGIMTYRTDGNCSTIKQLTYKVNHYVRQVPLYVWKFIKERNNDTDEGVVIVGINSPLVHNLHRSAKICSDICEELPWMEQLQKIRKLTTLGLVLCCRVSEVEHKLDNFPTFVRSIEPTQAPRFIDTLDATTPTLSTSTSDSNADVDYY